MDYARNSLILGIACIACMIAPLSDAALTPPPDANAIYGNAPLTVHFNAHGLGLSGDLTYHWNFGDGTESTEAAPSHTYQDEGRYNVRLTVRSGTNQATRDILVYTGGTDDTQFPKGDVNRDCVVNIVDLLAVRNAIGEPGSGNPADINGDGVINILDMLTVRNLIGVDCDTPEKPAAADPPVSSDSDWEFKSIWEVYGISTPKSDDGLFAQRAQVWDLGQNIPFTFNGTVGQPQGQLLNWRCTVRNYWGELLHEQSGSTNVASGGKVTASCSWNADYLGVLNVTFECDSASATMVFAVIKPMGTVWNNTENPFGAMGQHPGYDEYAPYLDLQKRIGMKRLRIPVSTEQVGRSDGTINTRDLDSFIDPLNQRGIQGYLLMAYFPSWMGSNTIDQRIDWFASYVGKVVAYCKNKGVRHYEIWNEPNLGHFWGWGAQKYLELLRKCNQAAKAADPNCVIISGGMPGLPGAFSGDIGNALITGAYKNDYDILAGHYYRYTGGYSPEHPVNNVPNMVKQCAQRAALAGKPTWDTESDYSYFYQTEWEQGNWFTRQMVYMVASGVKQITVYAFSASKDKIGYTSTWWHNFFGMIANFQEPVTFDYDNWPSQNDYKWSVDCNVYTPLPRYPAHSTIVHELVGATGWAEAILPDNNKAFVYRQGNDTRAVCWRGAEDQFTTPEQFVRGLQVSIQPVAIRDIFGNPVSSDRIPLGPSLVYVDFGSGTSVDAVRNALESGTIVEDPGTTHASFNLDFIAEKIYARTAGMPTKWYVLSPIADGTYAKYNNVIPAELAIAPDGAAKIDGTTYDWLELEPDIIAMSSDMNLEKRLAPNNKDKTTVLFAEFYSPTDRRGRIHYGATDDVRIWLNGEKVADDPPSGPYQPNRYTAPPPRDGMGLFWGQKPGILDIKKGRNTVFVKIHGRSGRFGIHFRIAWMNYSTMNDLAWQPK